jgi:hypothetical protein
MAENREEPLTMEDPKEVPSDSQVEVLGCNSRTPNSIITDEKYRRLYGADPEIRVLVAALLGRSRQSF